MSVAIVHKAQPTGELTEDMHILADEILPQFKTLEEQDSFCSKEAQALENALWRSLPGATYDRLLVAILQRTASHLRVPYSR
jgi:hypothetical protein